MVKRVLAIIGLFAAVLGYGALFMGAFDRPAPFYPRIEQAPTRR